MENTRTLICEAIAEARDDNDFETEEYMWYLLENADFADDYE